VRPTIIDEPVFSSQTPQAPICSNGEIVSPEELEDITRCAAQEARADPAISIALVWYEDEVEQLRDLKRRRDREAEEQYNDTVSTCHQQAELTKQQGMKRARDVLNTQKDEIKRDYDKAKEEINTTLERKYARARTARRVPQTLPPSAEARTGGDTGSSYPPSSVPISPNRNEIISPGPMVAAESSAPRWGHVRSIFSNGQYSPSDSLIDPQIHGANPAGAYTDGPAADVLEPEKDQQRSSSPSSLDLSPSDFCMQKGCHAQALPGFRYCHRHIGGKPPGAAF
jgi:hypothetical protein